MIRKVALAQALREAFPEEMSQLYEAEEMGSATENVTLDTTPVEMPVEPIDKSKVIEPTPETEKPVERNVGGQGSIDDIIFPPCLDNQPPFEV